MLTLEKAAQLKSDLFNVVQYCHDNDREFLEKFVSIKFDDIESLNAIYMSGSSTVIMLSQWYHDDLYDKTIPAVTQNVLEWVVKHQNKITQK